MSILNEHAKRKRPRLTRAAALLAALAAAAPGLFWLGAGAYDVGVTAPHSTPVEWLLQSAMERSIRAHADSVVTPEGIDLSDPGLAERAIGHYSVACATCHGAPGHPAAPWMVLYPRPSDLTRPEVVSRWTDAELYWIIKNGIKDTGMIALGPTHTDADLWAVSAFVRQLPQMSAERYHELMMGYLSERAEAPGGAAHDH